MSDLRIGVSAIVVRDGRLLMGQRTAAHGAGSWSFPGGHLEPGEHPAEGAARELAEETGLEATSVVPITWTIDTFERGLRYLTLHHRIAATGEPQVREPAKLVGLSWRWLDDLPAPLFSPVASLLATGWSPEEGSDDDR